MYVHRKVSFKGSRMTGSSSNIQYVHSKLYFKGSRMTGSSSNMFIVKYLLKAEG